VEKGGAEMKTPTGEKLAGRLLERLESGEIVSRSELLPLLWPNLKPENALNTISVLVNKLRKRGYNIKSFHGYRLERDD
jgi:DNA-binding response OmpR family regulator